MYLPENFLIVFRNGLSRNRKLNLIQKFKTEVLCLYLLKTLNVH